MKVSGLIVVRCVCSAPSAKEWPGENPFRIGS